MAGDSTADRPLFGGAISTIFPLRFQEVFVDPVRDKSLIIELLDLKMDVADSGSATWFLLDLANEQDAEGTTIVEQSAVFEAPGLSYRNMPAVITTDVGQMNPQTSNLGSASARQALDDTSGSFQGKTREGSTKLG